ncbi:MAG: tetratricopeptide repeat protein [Candidatus Syntrophosphaera sp.]|nr:tetratricopeptide repeat protein [Candidatus Syntrophosphaera sp.]
MKPGNKSLPRKIILILGLLIILFFLGELVFRPRVIRHGIASGHYSLRRYSASERIWSKLSAAGDKDHIPENSLGKVWYRRGDFSEAESHFADAVEENGQNPGARYDLGNALYRADRLDAALAEYKAAMLLDPEDQDAKANYELVLNRQGYEPPPPPQNEDGSDKEEKDQEQESADQENKQEQYRNLLDALDQKEALDRMARRKSRETEKGGKWW